MKWFIKNRDKDQGIVNSLFYKILIKNNIDWIMNLFFISNNIPKYVLGNNPRSVYKSILP